MTTMFNFIGNGFINDPSCHAFITAGKSVLINKRGASVTPNIDHNSEDPVTTLSEQLQDLLSDSATRDQETRLRTINLGEVVLKISGLLCLGKIDRKLFAERLSPSQLGVAVPGGAEVAIRRMQSYLIRGGGGKR